MRKVTYNWKTVCRTCGKRIPAQQPHWEHELAYSTTVTVCLPLAG